MVGQPKHSIEELQGLIHHKPIRVAQRLLREFGDSTEEMVIMHFPRVKEREELLSYIKEQRVRWEIRNWNKGYARTY